MATNGTTNHRWLWQVVHRAPGTESPQVASGRERIAQRAQGAQAAEEKLVQAQLRWSDGWMMVDGC